MDFNHESTVTTPPQDIVKILILQRRHDFFEALEQYNRMTLRGGNSGADPTVAQARLMTYWLEIQGKIEERKSPEDFKQFETEINKADTAQEFYNIAKRLNNFLLKDCKLLEFTTKKVYDSTSIETENEERT